MSFSPELAAMKRRPTQAAHLLGAMLASAIALQLAGPAAFAADPADPNWPCPQRKTPRISAVQVWSGPSLDEVGTSWRDDPEVAELASRLAARRTTLEEAKPLIAEFAQRAGAEKDKKLTAVAAGVLQLLNSERASIMSGIERYAKRQRSLAEKIEKETAELNTLPENGTEAEQSERADLLEILAWDSRIFQERQQALTYVCELPVQIERRAFELGRELGRHLGS